MQQGHQVVLVSSGAVGAGVSVLGLPSYPQELSLKQACAAVGQTRLMQAYENLFNHFNVDVAQLLLTAEDLKLRRRNVQATVLRLFEHGGIIPIVNENDTVSVEELKFGDNDILSVHMARLVEADALFILTSVDGPPEEGGRPSFPGWRMWMPYWHSLRRTGAAFPWEAWAPNCRPYGKP